jgi:hypothetical protein
MWLFCILLFDFNALMIILNHLCRQYNDLECSFKVGMFVVYPIVLVKF